MWFVFYICHYVVFFCSVLYVHFCVTFFQSAVIISPLSFRLRLSLEKIHFTESNETDRIQLLWSSTQNWLPSVLLEFNIFVSFRSSGITMKSVTPFRWPSRSILCRHTGKFPRKYHSYSSIVNIRELFILWHSEAPRAQQGARDVVYAARSHWQYAEWTSCHERPDEAFPSP